MEAFVQDKSAMKVSDEDEKNIFIEAVDIMNQIPANFYTQLDSKKWTDRKEALEIVEKATSVPKIQNGDFSELVRVLKKTIAKDSNIVVATLAAKCLYQLARGLRINFAPYSLSSLSVLFDKFKEKKPSVTAVIRDATDAVFVGTTIEDAHEEIVKYLDNKNPQIKSEVALFLTRIFARFSSQVRNKKALKPIIVALIKTLSDMDATVRDNSAMAIGTAMKVIGENSLMPLLGDVEPIKIAKVKEFCEKAEIFTAPVNGQNYDVVPGLTNGQENAPATEANGLHDDEPEDESNIYDSLEAVDITNQIPANFYTQLDSKKWTDRKEALEVIEKVTSVPKIQNGDFNELVRVLKKTIAKDSNIVVATLAAKCLFQMARGLRTNFAPYSLSSLSVLFDKFKEKKPSVTAVIRDAADAVFVGTNIEETHEEIIKYLDNKNPQIKSEVALFLTRIFAKFSSQVPNKKTLRPIIMALIKTLSDMDATVRDNSAMAIGTAMKVIGENLMMPLLADVEAIKITKVKEFCEKAQVKKLQRSVIAAVAQVNHQAAPTRSSSATMVRSTSKRPPSKPLSKPAATVKRTATIIKRSTATKRASAPQSKPPPVPETPVTQAPPPAPKLITLLPSMLQKKEISASRTLMDTQNHLVRHIDNLIDSHNKFISAICRGFDSLDKISRDVLDLEKGKSFK